MRKKFGIIGLGLFGSALARRLFESGHEVIGIDKDMERVESAADYCTNVVCLDAGDEKALQMQGIADMDVVIIAISEFESLITAADILKKMSLKKIMARYQSGLDIKILKMLGIEDVFNPEEKAALNMAEQFDHPSIRSSTIISGEYRISEIIAPKPLIGVVVKESRLRDHYSLNLITIKRPRKGRRKEGVESERILGTVTANTRIRAGDILVLFGKHSDIDLFLAENL